ncbi:hypothetical protein GTP56_25795 [Duganella sp. FT134W]|uniref:Tle cognate immunity protein 4 C-terminal domain-containing protein n=1 Tax=Duganella margarita TaxID=2692170 RepID=A0A7X4H571_9BURK|nr:T6SS immunity protein Tli4 family protein [Duganella margarita]MYM75585.1 hypothetical protein [Duganella margarita]
MKLSPKRWLSFVITVIGIAFILGHQQHQKKRENMGRHFEIMKMKTICVGRFLIDVPEKASLSYRGARLSGWDISSWLETDEKFLERISNEEIKLKSQKNEKGQVSLEQIHEIKGDHVHGRLFVSDRIWLEIFPYGVKEVSQAITIRAILRAHDVTFNLFAKIRSDNDVQEIEKIVTQLRRRLDDEIPEQPGFCFDRGFLTEPLDADQSEFTAVFLGLKEHPDLAIALSTYAGVAQDKSLLQRDAENDIKQQYHSRFHVLRQGPRALNGLLGEEVLERVDEPNGSVLHGFMWELLAKKDDVYRPLLTLELDTGRGPPGRPVNASLSDPEVLALWEKISGSLRVRPISGGDTHVGGHR